MPLSRRSSSRRDRRAGRRAGRKAAPRDAAIALALSGAVARGAVGEGRNASASLTAETIAAEPAASAAVAESGRRNTGRWERRRVAIARSTNELDVGGAHTRPFGADPATTYEAGARQAGVALRRREARLPGGATVDRETERISVAAVGGHDAREAVPKIVQSEGVDEVVPLLPLKVERERRGGSRRDDLGVDAGRGCGGRSGAGVASEQVGEAETIGYACCWITHRAS